MKCCRQRNEKRLQSWTRETKRMKLPYVPRTPAISPCILINIAFKIQTEKLLMDCCYVDSEFIFSSLQWYSAIERVINFVSLLPWNHQYSWHHDFLIIFHTVHRKSWRNISILLWLWPTGHYTYHVFAQTAVSVQGSTKTDNIFRLIFRLRPKAVSSSVIRWKNQIITGDKVCEMCWDRRKRLIADNEHAKPSIN